LTTRLAGAADLLVNALALRCKVVVAQPAANKALLKHRLACNTVLF
jgi:hypothetical protein